MRDGRDYQEKGLKKMGFECQRCGACCRTRSIEVSHSDIKRWWTEKRYDILREISWVDNRKRESGKGTGGFFIAGMRPCVFLLETNMCGIYETRPRACRDAPYGYDDFAECSAFHKNDISGLKRNMVLKGQNKDFRRAFFHQRELFGLIVEARRRFDMAKRAMGRV